MHPLLATAQKVKTRGLHGETLAYRNHGQSQKFQKAAIGLVNSGCLWIASADYFKRHGR